MINAVLVHKGNDLPSYLIDCVEQFFLFNPDVPLLLIIDRQFAELRVLSERFSLFKLILSADLPASENHRRFSRWNRLNSNYRGGFWRFAVERFFAIEDAMAAYALADVLHFEYDNLIYFSAKELEGRFIETTKGISLPADAEDRCIASLVFIKDRRALSDFCRTYNWAFRWRGLNDMVAFARYARRHRSRVSFLPVVPSAYKIGKTEFKSADGKKSARLDLLDRDFGRFRGVFDAAAFGQYLGGIDPRNDAEKGPGFINETALYCPVDFGFHWERDEQGRQCPQLDFAGGSCPIYNLHIHSKNLARFRSDREE